MRSALEYCHFLFYQNDILQQATRRLVSYFVTDMDFGGQKVGSDEQERWKELANTTGLMADVRHSMLSRFVYGNEFVSLNIPFKRFVACSCGMFSLALSVAYYDDRLKWSWDSKTLTPTCTCPQCGKRGPWKFQEEVLTDPSLIRLKHWSPLEIEIVYDPLSERCQYLWVIPEHYRQRVRQGNLWYLEHASPSVLDAVRLGWDYLFHPDSLLHLKEPVLAGIRTNGWGLSRYLTSSRQALYVQVLRRANEVVGMDFVIPTRIVTPDAGAGSSLGTRDQMFGTSPAEFMSFTRNILRRSRRDPAGWYTLPFPVKAQFLGGQANMIAPKDLLDQGQASQLNGMGIPVEFYQGTMRAEAGTIGLRIMESDNRDMVFDANRLVRWWIRRVARHLNWKEVRGTLQRVSLADSVDRIMMVLQLMTAGKTSMQSALGMLGLDVKTEERQKAEEVLLQADLQADLDRKLEQAGLAGEFLRGSGQQTGAAPPGAPPAAPAGPPGAGGAPPMGSFSVDSYLGSGNASRSPEEILAMADSLAIELLAQPESIKDSQLRQLKQRDELLHSATVKKMEAHREQQRLQAGAQAQAQAAPM
jgi:hypothetical protein